MAEHELVVPFWIDTDAYSDRDRLMFVAGVEFEMVRVLVSGGWRGSRTIHRENESRFRMIFARMGMRCEIEPCEGFGEVYSYLRVENDPAV